MDASSMTLKGLRLISSVTFLRGVPVRACWQQISSASITIGVNLDLRLRPEAAVLLSVNDTPFTASTLLERLLGKDVGDEKGIAPLHRPPVVAGEGSRYQGRLDPMMVPLFKDLSKVLEKVSQPIARELKKYVQINGRFLADLRPELIFYVQALQLIKKLQAAGLPVTYPELAPLDDRLCHVKSAYNLQLALQKLTAGSDTFSMEQIVTNDIAFGPDGRIAILTGPNQGGKTTLSSWYAKLYRMFGSSEMPFRDRT